MPPETPTLHMLCGKVASGKSTLARELANRPETVLISEDAWLSALFGPEMSSIADYVRYAARLETAMEPHITSLLRAGLSVVLDFQANTIPRRAWMRSIFRAAPAAHRLHYLDVDDATCLARLRVRNGQGKHPFAVTEAQFAQLSRHFVPPAPNEGFDVAVHHLD